MARPSKEHQAFTHLVDRLLAVPRSVVEQRIAAHREQAAQLLRADLFKGGSAWDTACKVSVPVAVGQRSRCLTVTAKVF